MGSLIINGDNKLEGVVKVSGSKNSALPILASTILTGREYIIKNVPDIDDVRRMLEILTLLGCKANYDNGICYINTKGLDTYDITDELSKKLRSSIIFLGPMLCRNNIAKITYPGGCDIGSRPIDLHLSGLRQLGVDVKEEGDFVLCKANNPHSGDVKLNYPSVGATENLMLFAVGLCGKTRILNAAKEPEIIDLQNYLNSCGYNLIGAGTEIITIYGNDNEVPDNVEEYSIMSDRIEAGTYLAIAAATKSKICLKSIEKEHMKCIINLYKKVGCLIDDVGDYIYIINNGRINAIDKVVTSPYPGFPTDLQAQVMSSLCIAKGISIIDETVFENRFKHVKELNKMGANIKVDGTLAIIKGVNKLHGANVNIRDLRGGAALIIAALSAEGISTLTNIHHVFRGYEHLIDKLTEIGADVKISE
ncbi:UDP-N-acetylglucosamine 1-carboxyvinyltransferase [Sedimentibacter sp. zth1]|uniref:UDP-N-acetylglucosamine 1-carboxyvinyltransferase n=1 Tax=Sedimentibacter sp. zth1 TaxID=2816908 RepID=UPI001A9341BA|nr:UDP-N-acetylglucosamine 1-carboxyvinyltransferase [Sedimentibacter sp. zth1]QSX06152.1 UDP-N-acetylglucosamine 1-carboxyvinyltransferase [Sedimentibacter sp. zth1]